ncbi:cell division protein FtsL [Vibrio porteresiae DSM 19223]|uniref:Cell division protein FtsL n=2 Tax=Vibrio porteresiae TaxID=435912 RepID=A0ABZ0QF63_9VIBR|nr:cell division protein FtsL [Vibrio porteresiae]WPC74616.1 cell division protein FtsL [Vibrio porteresiae DSM 19223]
MSQPTPNLAKLILIDLLTVGRVPLILLVFIFASAMGVVLTTHDTRQAVSKLDQVQSERLNLDNEWRNLIIEETALAEHSRVQDVAQNDLDMKRPDADKEVVINIK